MSASTSIEWTATVEPDGRVTPGQTWNPVRGCSIVSPGCVNCYAMKQAHRFSGAGKAYEGLTKLTERSGPQWTGKVVTVEDALLEPLAWRRPRRVFVNSMSDLFHESVPDEFIDRVFAVMALAKRHTFQILTKRAERMRDYLTKRRPQVLEEFPATATTLWHVWSATSELGMTDDVPWHWSADGLKRIAGPWPLPNVWLGVSAEDQQRADERIPLLLQTPAAVRFISAEPLLGRIDLEAVPLPAPGAAVYGLRGVAQPETERDTEPDDWKYWTRRQARIDWVIVGGESGPGARPLWVPAVRRVVEQCRAARVAVFVKQLGADVRDRNDAGFLGEEPDHWPEVIDQEDRIEHDLDGTRDGYQGAPVRIHLKHCKGGDPSEWPEDLRVREFPAVL